MKDSFARAADIFETHHKRHIRRKGFMIRESGEEIK
jgi:hypothetical protein